jgi:hypothetical protein
LEARHHEWAPVARLGVHLSALSCGPGQTSSQPAADTAGKNEDAWPTDDEVRAYLDGKSLPLQPEPGNDGKQGPSITVRRANITALEVNHAGVKVAGEPWSTSATFLYDYQGTKYAVEIRLNHRKVAGQRAFFGFDVVRVAKQ